MADALYSVEAYRDALIALLPRGRVWNDDVQRLVMTAAARGFERFDARAQGLLFDAFPPNTLQLLPEWEVSLALPDPCEGEDQTTDQRRAQVLAKFCASGGQSIPYYRQVLDTLGYTNAEITEFAPFRVGRSRVGQPLYGSDWWYAWNINLPDVRTFLFRVGSSTVGQPLSTYSQTSVFCVIDVIKPAHTVVSYTFDPA